MESKYYIRLGGRIEGPYPVKRLHLLAQRGRFSITHEISTDRPPRLRSTNAGAVDSFGSASARNTCIAIRTGQVEDGLSRWQAGAGIVVASRPKREAEETREKARAMARALDVAERGLG